jgi:hypothetical protein
LEEIHNEGMQQWPKRELEKKVSEARAKNPNAPVPVFESRNFVAKFVSELNLRHFPFDQQDLRIVSTVYLQCV